MYFQINSFVEKESNVPGKKNQTTDYEIRGYVAILLDG